MGDGNDLPSDLIRSGADALLPGLGAVGGRLSDVVRSEWKRNTSRALRVAEDASGLSREDLEELLVANPETVPLLVQVLYAAGMNGHDRTLRAMGAALGLAADATRRTDRHTLADIEGALRGMREFDDRHFAVLGYLAPLAVPRYDEHDVPDYDRLSTEAIASAVGLAETSATACCLALASAGLLHQAPAMTIRHSDRDTPDVYFHGEHVAYVVTALGRALCEAARLEV